MTKIIAIVNQKGGVGKTTTAINLSSCLAAAEQKTLLIDMDPQANSTSGVGFEKDNISISIYDVLIGRKKISQVIKPTELAFLNLIPSAISLVGAEVELVTMVARETRLKEALDALADDYRYIIIDCPPSLGVLTLNGLVAAEYVLIPLQCEYFALEGLALLLQTVGQVQKSLSPGLQIGGILFTMYDQRTRLAHEVVQEVTGVFKDRVFRTIIPRNVRISEAPSHSKPINRYDPECMGAKSYRSLAQEVLVGA